MTSIRLLATSVLTGAAVIGAALYMHQHGVRAANVNRSVAPETYFPKGSPWTEDISKAPLDPKSSELITQLAQAGGWGNGNKLQVDFGLRVVAANSSTPRVPFHPARDFYTDDSDGVSYVPLPEGGGMEAQEGYHCKDGDCHFIVVDRAHSKLYEAWGANYDGAELTSRFIAVWNLNKVYPPSGRGDQCTSADAAGLPIAPLLFNADEIAAGSISHAVRFILPGSRIRARYFVHPATHSAGATGGELALPMGTRLRLKASYDMSELSPAAQVVARAMQKYGLFLSDNGNIAITAQSDRDTVNKYSDVGFDSHSLWPLKVTDFEVVESGPPIALTDNCILNP